MNPAGTGSFLRAGLLSYLQDKYPGIILDLAYSSKRGSPELEIFLKEFSKKPGELVDMRISGSPQPGDLRALWQIYQLVRRHRPELIHAHSSKSGALVRLLDCCRACRRSCIPPTLILA